MTRMTIDRLNKSFFPLMLIATLTACGGSDNKITEKDPVAISPAPVTPEHHDSGARLLVTKAGVSDQILVFDLGDNKKIADLSVAGTVSGLYASPSNRYAIANQSAAGIVNFIDSGVEWEIHGDHGHLHLTAPDVLDLQLAGVKPGHVTLNGDQTTIFFDGQEGVPASIRALTEEGIGAGTVLAEYTDNVNQHGDVQAWGDYLITTVRDPAVSSPTMVKVSARDGGYFNEIKVFDASEHACPGLHGSAQNSGYIVFGCIDGVLTLEQQGGQFQANKLSHTIRISSLYSHPNVIDFVGTGRNTSDEPVSLFAVSAATQTITPIAYDKTPRAYTFAEEGELFVVLDTEGGLTAFDTHTWAVVKARLQVTAAAETSGQISRLTASADGHKIYVADVGAQKIQAVDVHNWSIDNASTISLDFAPGMILWLGSDAEGADNH